jgi:hypothetical protein
VGAGVGVSLGVSLVVIVVLYLRERHNNKKLRSDLAASALQTQQSKEGSMPEEKPGYLHQRYSPATYGQTPSQAQWLPVNRRSTDHHAGQEYEISSSNENTFQQARSELQSTTSSENQRQSVNQWVRPTERQELDVRT